VDKRKLVKELAALESTDVGSETAAKGEEMSGINIVLRDFQGSVDVDRMIQTATEIIKRNQATVTIFYGADEHNARIMVTAGKTALEKGANAGEIVTEASKLLGGGGGGRPNFAQGGGTQVGNVKEAVKKAKEALKKQLKP
jgi:alanyl-tRNA synthetase